MLSGAAANLNPVTKALTSQPCKQGKQPFRNRFFQTTHSKISKCTLLQIASPLIICEPEMLLFKGWKNLLSWAQHPVLQNLLNYQRVYILQQRHALSFITHSSSEQIQQALNYFEQIWHNSCSSKEPATASIEDVQSLTPVSWARRCCEHSTKSAQASHNSHWHCDSSKGQQPNTVIPTCVAHRQKKHSVTLREKAFFHFLA